MTDGRMKGYLDQQVPYTSAQKPAGHGMQENRVVMAARRKSMDPGVPHVPDSEDLFHDLNLLQETWLAEAQVPDSDEQFVPDFHSENLALHSPPAKIKKEPQSPCSEASTSCRHRQPFQYRHGEQCLYARQDPNFVNPSGPPQSAPSRAYLMEHSSYQVHPETGQPFSVSQTLASNTPPAYQHPLPAPCRPYPPQGFKQEFHDPMYEQANALGATGNSQYTAGVVIKQEQMDYAFETASHIWIHELCRGAQPGAGVLHME